jgi:predicted ATP-grasp superfamily ATP-dependent carboligase
MEDKSSRLVIGIIFKSRRLCEENIISAKDISADRGLERRPDAAVTSANARPDGDERRTVVVTHGHTRIGFNVTRSLVAAGYRIVSASRYTPGMCRGLPGVVAEVAYPDPFAAPANFLGALAEAARTYAAAAILPLHEEIFPATLWRAQLEAVAPVLAPPFSQLMELQDKGRLPDLARRAGVATPPSAPIATYSDLKAALPAVGLPAVIKPRFGSGAHGVRTIATPGEIESRREELDRLLVKGRFLVQAWVPGRGAAIGGVFSGGRALALTGHLRLREIPITGGASTARLTFRHAELERAAADLFAAIGFSGVGMAEFRYDPASDRFWLLEINPRYWGGIGTAIASGVPVPVVHARSFFHEPPGGDAQLPGRTVESRWLLGELRAFVELLNAGRWREAVALFHRSTAAPIVWDDFSWRRPAPFIAEARAYLRSYRNYGNLGGHGPAKEQFFASREP